MADKKEQRFKVIASGKFLFTLETPPRLFAEMGTANFNVDEWFDSAKLLESLYNAAIDINPSNPMAVAEGLEKMVLSCKILSQLGVFSKEKDRLLERIMPTESEIRFARDTYAAITKPANEERK